MPTFTYKAKQGPLKIVDGRVEANSLDNAIAKITELGYVPLDVFQSTGQRENVEAKKIIKPLSRLWKKVSPKDKVFFTREISDLVEASVPILKSLQIVSRQTQNIYFRGVIEEMALAVKDGGSLSDALAKYPDIFSSFYVNLVKTGEVSGKLKIVLNRLSDYLEKEMETLNKIKSSLAYPLFILGVGVVTVFVLLTFVIPRLSVMFDELNQALPLPTQIMINLSMFFANFWWLIIGACILMGIYLKEYFSSLKGRLWLDRFQLKLPFFGEFIKTIEIGRFARTMATLVEGGVVITTALNSVWATINNLVLKAEIKKVSESVSNGSSLRAALTQCVFFPEMAVNMIAVGEETGRLEKGFYKIADTFERQSDETMKAMVSLLGPIVLVLIVSMVGFVVVAMLLPIFQMNTIIQ